MKVWLHPLDPDRPPSWRSWVAAVILGLLTVLGVVQTVVYLVRLAIGIM